MNGAVVGLFLDRWRNEVAAPRRRRIDPGALWRKAVWFKANPRSADYMRARLEERCPGAQFIELFAGQDFHATLAGAERVILLYPDAIGLGFSRLERYVLARVPDAAVLVLNGRRRFFVLDRGTRRRLLVRRALEQTMLIECLAGLAMLIATPILLAFDLARGRR